MNVYAKITNVGTETIPYISGSSSCPTDINLSIVHQKSNTLLITAPPKDCTLDLVTSQLKPNQTVEHRWAFIPKQWINNNPEPAEAGIYDVKISLPSTNSNSSEVSQDGVTTEIILLEKY